MAKARRKRSTYTPAQRASILAAAQSEGLTAAQVNKKFGVTPVTYYSWRKKTVASARRGRAVSVAGVAGIAGVEGIGDLGSTVRAEVRTKVRQLLPEIVRGEVSNYLSSIFGETGGKPRKVRT